MSLLSELRYPTTPAAKVISGVLAVLLFAFLTQRLPQHFCCGKS